LYRPTLYIVESPSPISVAEIGRHFGDYSGLYRHRDRA